MAREKKRKPINWEDDDKGHSASRFNSSGNDQDALSSRHALKTTSKNQRGRAPKDAPTSIIPEITRADITQNIRNNRVGRSTTGQYFGYIRRWQEYLDRYHTQQVAAAAVNADNETVVEYEYIAEDINNSDDEHDGENDEENIEDDFEDDVEDDVEMNEEYVEERILNEDMDVCIEL